MVHAKEPRLIAGELRFRAMRKRKLRTRRDRFALFQSLQIPVPRNPSERQYCSRLQYLHFALEVGPAVQNFPRQRLVRRGRATNRRRDISIPQLQSIIAMRRARLVCEPGPIQCGIKKVARAVSRKHSPRSVCSVRRRSQSNQQQPRISFAKSRHRPSPVSPFAERPPFLSRHLFPVRHQPRALLALHNFIPQNAKCRPRIQERPFSIFARAWAWL
jgi:hypothetical protein